MTVLFGIDFLSTLLFLKSKVCSRRTLCFPLFRGMTELFFNLFSSRCVVRLRNETVSTNNIDQLTSAICRDKTILQCDKPLVFFSRCSLPPKPDVIPHLISFVNLEYVAIYSLMLLHKTLFHISRSEFTVSTQLRLHVNCTFPHRSIEYKIVWNVNCFAN